MALVQVPVCCGKAGEEGTEEELMRMLWSLKSSEVVKIYRKNYMLNL